MTPTRSLAGSRPRRPELKCADVRVAEQQAKMVIDDAAALDPELLEAGFQPLQLAVVAAAEADVVQAGD
jgi:hypothetical protein